jgi:hypothetical protein
MRRFSLRTLMAFILVAAVGLAALRNANDRWAGVMLLTALASVGVSFIGAALMRGREQAWWLGFAVFGGGYLAVCLGPWVGDAFRQQLSTTHWIGELRNLMFDSSTKYLLAEKEEIRDELAKLLPAAGNYDPVASSLRNSLRSIDEQLTKNRNATRRFDSFQSVGHCLFVLLSGLMGGTVAVWFDSRRRRAADNS